MLNELISLIKEKALFVGDFTLSNGQKSDCYIDLSKITLSSRGAYLTASLIIDSVDKWNGINAVGGPSYGAIPLVASILTLMEDSDWLLNGFFIRKESKTHGKNDLIEGHLNHGDKVILIEDITTSGESLLKSVDVVRKAGGVVVQVVSILDRKQGAKERFNEIKIPFTYLISIDQILNTM